MTEWRPIETAPKAGEPVLLYSKYDGIGTAIWDTRRWVWWADGLAIEYMSDFGTEYNEFNVPTHWMPLPQPPE